MTLRAPGPGEVRVPRALRDYRCERTLMCCREPYAAPVSTAEEAVLRAALPDGGAGLVLAGRAIAKPYGSCAHLIESTQRDRRACALHVAVGLAALPAGCRNFPRLVEQVGDGVEVAFSLSCPTAARLVAEDPSALEMVSVDAAAWPWRAQLVRDTNDRAQLRDRWLAVVAGVRRDPEPLLMALAAMLATPDAPPEVWELPDMSAALLAPCATGAALELMDMLALVPERGPSYEAEREAILGELAAPWTPERAIAASEAMPELVAAFVEHQLLALTGHRQVAPAAHVRLLARRAAMVLRVVDAVCDRLPFRSKTLFADAYVAVAQLDPDAEREAYRDASLDPT